MQPTGFKFNSTVCRLFLLWALFAQVILAARRTSITMDEPLHIASGYACLFTGDYRLVEEHPPLMKMLQAAPLLLAQPPLPDPRTITGWEEADLGVVAKNQIIPYRPFDTLVFAARVPTLWVALILAALIYRWASDCFGRRAGLLALFLAAFDPNLLAHAGFAATDLGATAGIFAASYFFWRWLRQPAGPSWRRSLPAAVVLGLALGTKTTALMLIPVMGLGLLFLRPPAHPLRRYWGQALVAGIVALWVLWALYRFQIGTLPGFPFPVPAPDHFRPLLKLQSHMRDGHAAFLMGKNYHYGDWRYFPIAFLLKTPPLTLILLLGTGLGLISRRLRTPDWRLEIALLLLPAFYIASSIVSSINIGYRHLLPILPFFFVWISRAAALRWRRLPRWTARALLTGYAAVTLLIFPWHLAYFNILAGGPDGGYRYLVDSNLDWGQSWKALREYLTSRGISRFHFSSFTIVDPRNYGLDDYIPLPPWPGVPPIFAQRFAPPPGVYVLSASQLQGIVLVDPELFDYFRRSTPVARIGHALFVYEVSAPPSPAWIAQCSVPGVPLPPEALAEGFGRSDLRQIPFDCSGGWIFPSGNGWYILHGDGVDPATLPELRSARLAYRQTGRGAYPPFSIYEWFNRDPLQGLQTPTGYAAPGEWLPEQVLQQGTALTLPARLGADLEFLGFSPQLPALRAGQSVTISTYWQIVDRPAVPLSLMAHLLDAAGRPVAVGDGLSVPVDQWVPGDIIVQRHRLEIPADAPAGPVWLQVGAYTLPDVQRLPLLQGEMLVGDRLLIVRGEVAAP